MTRPTPPTPSPAQLNVSRIVKVLLPLRQVSQNDLARALGAKPSVISKALSAGRKWTVDEVAIMAEFFDCSVSVFFDEPESLLRGRVEEVIDLRDHRQPEAGQRPVKSTWGDLIGYIAC